MAKEVKLTAKKRDVSGTHTARRLRREGSMPAVICDEKGHAESIQVNVHEFERMLHLHGRENLILDLTVEGDKARRVFLKEVQHDPVEGNVLHADFVEISMTRKIRVGIATRLIGEPVGVSQQGGVLEHVLREVEVECLPGDLVDSIDVDVSALDIGDTLLVRNLKIDPKLTLLTGPDVAVATVAAPRQEEEVVAEAAAVEGAEPEVITAKKEGEEGAEGEAAKPGKGEKEGKAKPEAKGKPEAKAPAEKAGTEKK
jgi:large subunit ribosomal protein L25